MEPKIHLLKTWPQYFGAVGASSKQFELRRNDRDFKVGDAVVLMEWSPETERYTGRILYRSISYLVTDGPWLAEGYAALGLWTQIPNGMTFEVVQKIVDDALEEWAASIS